MLECKRQDLFLWMIRLRRRRRVVGSSMLPLLRAGDEVLIDPYVYRRREPGIGEIVVARHPDRNDLQIIKRIRSKDDNGRYLLLGDNPDQTQNTPFWVSEHLILGRVSSLFS